MFVSKNEFTWFDAYIWTLNNNMNLYAPTTHLNLIHLLEFLTRNNMKGPFWVLKDRFSFLFKYKIKIVKIGGIRINETNFWIDKRLISDGPW